MRKSRRLALPCLALLALVAAARGARAQTYIWTDERGVVHAAADPGEVPEKYRAKSVHDAQRPRSNVTVLQPDEPETPAAADSPNAEAPMKPGKKPEYAAPKADAPAPPQEAPPQAAAPAADDVPKPKGLPAPADGFEWSCTADPDGGKPKCEQFEKRSSKRQRHAAARAEARKQMGIDPDQENDPDVKAEMQRRADQEYEKSTTKPPPAPKRGSDDDDDSGSSDPDD